MSIENVQKALLARFVEVFGVTFIGRIAYENVTFTPPAALPWLAPFFIPVTENLATLGGVDGLDTADGILQVNINTPSGNGESACRGIVTQLRSCFLPQSYSYGGQYVSVLTRARRRGFTSGSHWVVPFDVRWRAQISRNT